MLCADLPPRLYESLTALCCLANASGALQAHEIGSPAVLPPAETARILQLMTWAGFVESRRGTKGGLWLVASAERIWGTAATVTASILGGAHIIRIHDVSEMVQVARVADCLLAPKKNHRE